MVQHHLVLLPGLDGTGELFAPFLNILPESYTPKVVTYPRDRPLGYRDLIPRIREAIPWDQPYTFIAESYSGPLALLFAAAQPEDIRAIVLCASFVTNPLHPLLDWGKNLLRDSWFQKPPPPALLKKFLLGEDCPPILLENFLQTIATVSPAVLAHRVREVLNTDVRAQLQECAKPILYLQAAHDKIVSERSWNEIAALQPTATRVTLDAPHLLLQRQPRAA